MIAKVKKSLKQLEMQLKNFPQRETRDKET